MKIHPTAVVDAGAELAEGVQIGPYVVIKSDVVIGEDTEIMSHVFVDRYTTIGPNCRLFPFASVGAEPQDLKFKGEKTELIIGRNVTIREGATLHRGTGHGGGRTTVGDDCLIMNYVHVAHDCHVGHNVILSNNATMAGHVTIQDHVTLSGLVGIHQFTRIGTHAYIGGFSRITKDVPPYILGEGSVEFKLHGPNVIGLKRKGFTEETVNALKDVFHIVFRNHRPLQEVLDEASAAFPESPEVKLLIDFMRSSERGVYR
ncbi:MAG: acyl-ACP--UDP-N-acetylglucosamine O-acyltransferase [Thermodesulfobacteriota bacterium]